MVGVSLLGRGGSRWGEGVSKFLAGGGTPPISPSRGNPVLFQEDMHNVISAAFFCHHDLFTFQKFCLCIDDTFLVPNKERQ